MITIDRKKGYIVISRSAYLYRNGGCDDGAFRDMGDGDIIVPLPDHMKSKEWDNRDDGKGRVLGSDGQSAEIIIAEIARRLGENQSDSNP